MFRSSLAKNVNALKILVCAIEEAPAQRNLLSFVFSAAVPIVCVVAGLMDEPTMIDKPKNQSRLITSLGHFPLIRHNRRVDGSL